MILTRRTSLSKKLKRRITELCGFQQLSREERLSRATEILNSNELKQAICHKILGASFKDIDKVMTAIINERQLTPDQEDEIELQEIAPEKFEPKFDPDLEFKLNKKAADPSGSMRYEPYTREEVAALIEATNAPYESPPGMECRKYGTYTREQVAKLMQEQMRCTKTIVLESKTRSQMKHLNSSKG